MRKALTTPRRRRALMKSVRTMTKRKRKKKRWIQDSQTSIAQLGVHGSPEVKGCAINIFPHCDYTIECGFKKRGVGDIDDDEDDDVI